MISKSTRLLEWDHIQLKKKSLELSGERGVEWDLGGTRLLAKILNLKVHKIENFFGSEFEFCTISLLLLLKY
jgi:hypothetical protein